MKKILTIETPNGTANIDLTTLEHYCSENVKIDYAVDALFDNGSYKYNMIVEPDGRLHSESYERHFEYLRDCVRMIKQVERDCRQKGITLVSVTIDPCVYVYDEREDEYQVVEHDIKLIVKDGELRIVRQDYTQWSVWSEKVLAESHKNA